MADDLGAPVIDLRPQDTTIVQSILAASLGRDVKTWVFGSRASGASRRTSDLDLLIDAGNCFITFRAHPCGWLRIGLGMARPVWLARPSLARAD